MNVTQQTVLKTLRSISRAQLPDDQELLESRYLEKGFIDSLDFVDLVTKLEKEFKIRFSHTALQSDGFQTLAGISEAIERGKKG